MPRIANATKLAEEEIEITPEMIEAGAAELASVNLDFEMLEEAAERIYRAMAYAFRGSRRSAFASTQHILLSDW